MSLGAGASRRENRPVDHRPPEPASDAGAAEWIAPRLIGDFGAICRTVPSGFSAYARILHPVNPGSGAPVRWSEVAQRNGRTMHPLAQFARIATPADAAPNAAEAPVDAPMLGELAADQLAALCAILRRRTSASRPCWYALWDGWGELNADSTLTLTARDGSSHRPGPAPTEWQLDLRAATFDLPGRRYYLFTGPLDDATRLGHWVTRAWFLPRSPNLFWPDDHAWCVASEIDFDSTLVGGSARLIADILHNADLEGWQVAPCDSLTYDADTINQP